MSSVVITEGIFDLFKERPAIKKKQLNQFIQSDFVLSDDTNSILEYNLKKRRIRNAVIDNIISLFLDNQILSKMNISVKTQLIYSICRAIDCTDIKYAQFKDRIEIILTSLQNDFTSNQNSNICDFIQYRTLCIVKDRCFLESSFLSHFNETMLSPNSKYLKYNLIFYLLYYSKREFCFSEVINFNLQNIDYEMYCNTFYVLKNSIYSNNQEDLILKYLKCSPILIMDLYTWITLVNSIQIKERMFLVFFQEAQVIANSIFDVLRIIESRDNSLIDSSLNEDLKKRLASIITGINE